jgi:aminopeptidase N
MNIRTGLTIGLVLGALVPAQYSAYGAAGPEGARLLHTELDVTIEPERGEMSATATLTVDLSVSGPDRLIFGLNRGLFVESVSGDDGQDIPYDRTDDSLIVRLPPSLNEPAPLDITVIFAGPLHNDAEAMGYSMATISPECSFASWLSSWYPQLLDGNGKSPGTIKFSVPAGLVAVSNGRLTEQSTAERGSQYVFSVQEPVYYSFAVGAYEVSRRYVHGVELTTHFLSGDAAKREWYLDRLGAVLDFYANDLYGMYPYSRCSLVELPRGVMGRSGGSSEQGLFFFPDAALDDAYFSLPVVAHEIGHAYWGNWVIGDGVFMSEGLAQASCALCLENMLGSETMRVFLKYGSHDSFQSAALYFATAADDEERDLPLGTPMAQADPMTMHFLSNTKGVCVLMMLRDRLGEGPFREALRSALADHAHSLMSVEQLQEEFERASGQDLDPFFDEWFGGTGALEFALEHTVSAVEGTFRVTGSVRQTRGSYEGPIDLVLRGREGSHRLVLGVSSGIARFDASVPFRPLSVEIDPGFKLFRKTEEFASLRDFGEGFERYLAGDFDGAEDSFRRQLASAPNSILPRFWLADLCSRFNQDYASVVEQLEPLVQAGAVHCPSPFLWSSSAIMLGNAKDALGKRPGALACYERVLQDDETGLFHRLAAKYLELPYVQPPPLPPPPPPPGDSE